MRSIIMMVMFAFLVGCASKETREVKYENVV